MNLLKMFEAQKLLREKININHNLVGQDLLPNSFLALQVEVGELANEWRGFKHWSKNKAPRILALRKPAMCEEDKEYYNPLLDEFADCLSFILDIGLDLGLQDIFISILDLNMAKEKSGTEHFSYIFSLIEKVKATRKEFWYECLVVSFISLGEFLGFDWEQIEQAYFEKNAINHQRQNEGY